MSARRSIATGRIPFPPSLSLSPWRHSTLLPSSPFHNPKATQRSSSIDISIRRHLSVSAYRPYQHSSSHAPASKERSNPLSNPASSESQAHNGIAYSRHELISSWHAAAREVSPSEISFEKRESIDVNYLILRQDGEIERPQEKLRKERLLKEFGLLPRDLRSLDAHVLDVRPSLIVCGRSMILCTPVIRAIISSDEVVLIGSDRENPICSEEDSEKLAESVQKVMRYLDLTNAGAGGTTSKEEIPFELRALEALLLLTVRGLKEVATTLQEKVYSVIPQLRFGVSPAELRDLLECKRSVEDVLLGGRAIQSALSAILGEDEDLAGMYLTDKAKGQPHDVANHQTAELLLEYYERRLDEVNESCQRLATLLSEVDSNISLVLASTRVRLQNLELQTAIATLGMSGTTVIAGLFGMNLVSGLEDHPTAFFWATGSGLGLMGVIMSIGWLRLVRARRSQLFLRSALKRRKDEELSHGWGVGPVASISLPRDGKGKETNGESGKDEKGTAEDRMLKKDGTQL
ncbi:CorA family magnesium transporter [Sporobolomyces salmoneus]|uniref:CorA family magnesium transporter n=1 Tax=Sporobolomyces salmoneus TaxID=183962 RepID=UPI00317C2DAC